MSEGNSPHALRRFLQSWLICTLAVLVAVHTVPGIHFKDDSLWPPFVAALVLGILNALLRPLLLLLALPLLLLTLGLFFFVINAMLLWLVGALLEPHFFVEDFWSAFWGALVISLVTGLLNILTGNRRSRVVVRRQKAARPPRDDGNGPVIDV